MTVLASSRRAQGIAALTLGAFFMGASVLFVRFADVGPFASAFWRAALALPALAIWAAAEAPVRPRLDAPALLAGLFFAGDLIFWHLAIWNTSVANATVLATTSPLWVTAYAAIVLRQKVSAASLTGLAACLVGAFALVGESWHLDPERLAGDGAGLVTALFFAGYFLAMGAARRRQGPAAITFASTVVTSAVLLVVALALEPTLWPGSWSGALSLLALALVSQVGGLGLLAVGLKAVPPAFGALVFVLEVVSAAVLGAVFLHESLSLLQLAGAGLIILGLVIARPRAVPPQEAAPRPALPSLCPDGTPQQDPSSAPEH